MTPHTEGENITRYVERQRNQLKVNEDKKDDKKLIIRTEQQIITILTTIEPITIPTTEPVTTTTSDLIIAPISHGLSSQTGGHSRRANKGKKAMTLEEQSSEDEQGFGSDSYDIIPPSPNVESSKLKKLKKFSYVTKFGERDFFLRALGHNVVEGFFKKKIVCDRQDGTDEFINEFKVSDICFNEWREVMNTHGKRTGARWAKVFKQMKKNVDDFNNMAVFLGLGHSIALSVKIPCSN
ncbi:hypothetical protein Tco_0803443 [Tanacetum coccineum]|uniref:Uncharacterized protein n=1 Tax=Tanacetum coccineum TaxID=301880 RepID=A0ABQ5A5S5_9ASTR